MHILSNKGEHEALEERCIFHLFAELLEPEESGEPSQLAGELGELKEACLACAPALGCGWDTVRGLTSTG